MASPPAVTPELGAGSLGEPEGHPELRKPFVGQLSKFTNVMKGWQFRRFVLDPEEGTLQYYIPEEASQKCRGQQHLAGAEVLPSVEDEHTFQINFASKDVFKLRSASARERQMWVDRIRAVIELHNQALPRAPWPVRDQLPATPPGAQSHLCHGEPSEQLQHLSLSILDAFGSVHDILRQADRKNAILAREIEALPSSLMQAPNEGLRSLDENLLILKATSTAGLMAMEQSLAVLQACVEERRKAHWKAPKPLQLSPESTMGRSQFFASSPTRSILAIDKGLSTSTSSLPAVTLSPDAAGLGASS